MTGTQYTWRDAKPTDLAGLEALEAACFQADGPELVSWSKYEELASGASPAIACAVTPGLDVAAVAWVRINGSPAMVGGKVHPQHRRQGLGSQALHWGEDYVRRTGGIPDVIIRNEAVTDGAESLYHGQGYTTDFVEYWMNRDLAAGPLAELPADIRIEAWSQSNAIRFYETFIDAFQDRGGTRESAVRWISWNTDDEDFRPDLCLLAYLDDQPVAFVTAGPMRLPRFDRPIGHISQMGVRPPWRGRGIVDGLIGEIGRRLQQENFATLGLDVNLNNPRAQKVYQRNGFTVVGKRARYSKTLE